MFPTVRVEMSASQNRGLRQPRLAEMIASILRDRIISGELSDGDELPKQEDLIEEFQVSKPSLREALRILETEGLVTVRRGNVGGAVVHVPRPDSVAYMFGGLLQAHEVTTGDLAQALRHLEPICASLCASREDREKEVVPKLEESLDAAKNVIDDPVEFTDLSRVFHELLVELSGNETMILLVGTLESVWSAQERDWAKRASEAGGYPERPLREKVLKAHRRMLAAIRKGDDGRATNLAREHLESTQAYALEGSDGAVVRSSRPARTA